MAKNMAKKSIGEFNPTAIPAWVSEGSMRKYDRAVKQLRDAKEPVTEEAVKALYVKWNGLVLDTDEQEADVAE